MAIVASNLTSGASESSVTSVNTASITPTANCLVLVRVNSRTGITATPNTPTITGCGLTWVTIGTPIEYDTSGSSRRKITIIRALGASPSSGALTIDFGGQTQTSYTYSVDEFSGVDTSGTNGSGAIVQNLYAKDETPPTGLTITLSAFSSTNNATYGSFGESNGYSQTGGSGFTVLSNNTTTTSVSSGSDVTSFNDATIPADSFVWLETTAKSGTVTELNITLVYTED